MALKQRWERCQEAASDAITGREVQREEDSGLAGNERTSWEPGQD